MRYLRITLTALLLAALLPAADQSLLNLVMPDAKVVAGLQVERAKTSEFGRYVLSHMQPDDASFKKFLAATNFDPRQDLSEIVMASNWQGQAAAAGRWLILARGTFDAPRITSAVVGKGGTKTSFLGVDLLSGGGPTINGTESVIAFLDGSRTAMGDPDSVKAVIQRFQTKPLTPAPLPAKVQSVSAKYDFWFVTLVPLSEFAGLMPDNTAGQAMKGNVFQSIQQASGGVKFGKDVQIAVECLARSDKDATALADVMRFLGSLIQTNRDKSATASQVSTLLDTMTLDSTGNVMTMSLAIPENMLEQILTSARRTPKKVQPTPQ